MKDKAKNSHCPSPLKLRLFTTHSNHVTSNNLPDTLICHTTMCSDSIHILYIDVHVTLWCLKVISVVYASDAVPQKNMSEIAFS